jgi:hypothetical protein
MDAQIFMSLESFSRLSQAIKEAAESVDPEVAKAHAAVSVNSIGVQSTAKRTVRPTAFSEATDFLGEAIKTAREAKLARARDNKETNAEKPEAAKSLAELLAESAQDSE